MFCMWLNVLLQSWLPTCTQRVLIFHEILLLARGKRVHFSHATQLFSDFGIFLYYLQEKALL